MGVDYSAKAVIGVKINAEKLYKIEKKPGCKHEHKRNDQGSFCPTCGKPRWIERERSILNYDEEEYEDTFLGTPIHRLTFDEHKSHQDFIVGNAFAASEDGESAHVHLPDNAYATEREKLRNILEPHGLWDESQFGLWCILHCSY